MYSRWTRARPLLPPSLPVDRSTLSSLTEAPRTGKQPLCTEVTKLEGPPARSGREGLELISLREAEGQGKWYTCVYCIPHNQ